MKITVNEHGTNPLILHGNGTGKSTDTYITASKHQLIRNVDLTNNNFTFISWKGGNIINTKTILEKSVYVPQATAPCLLPGNSSISTPFNRLSKTGGIVNAYNAVVLANSMGNK